MPSRLSPDPLPDPTIQGIYVPVALAVVKYNILLSLYAVQRRFTEGFARLWDTSVRKRTLVSWKVVVGMGVLRRLRPQVQE